MFEEFRPISTERLLTIVSFLRDIGLARCRDFLSLSGSRCRSGSPTRPPLLETPSIIIILLLIIIIIIIIMEPPRSCQGGGFVWSLFRLGSSPKRRHSDKDAGNEKLEPRIPGQTSPSGEENTLIFSYHCGAPDD